jgi:hypothetical protein
MLVEEQTDDLLRENLAEAAWNDNSNGRKVFAVVKNRLLRTYGRKRDEPKVFASASALLDGHATSSGPSVRAMRKRQLQRFGLG